MSPANPYMLAGVGIGVVSLSDLTISGAGTISADSESKFFVEVGGGVEFSKVFIQAKFVNIFTEGSSVTYFPITLGVMY